MVRPVILRAWLLLPESGGMRFLISLSSSQRQSRNPWERLAPSLRVLFFDILTMCAKNVTEPFLRIGRLRRFYVPHLSLMCDAVYGGNSITHLKPESYPAFDDLDEVLAAFFDGIAYGYYAPEAFNRGHIGAIL
jgi:hypothetical protein